MRRQYNIQTRTQQAVFRNMVDEMGERIYNTCLGLAVGAGRANRVKVILT